MKPRPRSDRGDTLVEVIVSIVVLAIVTAGLLAGMTTTTASSVISRNQANAEAALTSVGEAVRDPTLYPYQCSSATYSLLLDVPKLPTGWTVQPIPITAQWNGTAFVPFAANQCKGMQLLTITVQSPDGQLTWSREVAKGALG